MKPITDSVIYNGDRCYVCGGLAHHKHHAIHGTSKRKLAEKWKLYIPLCHLCHTAVHDSKDRRLDNALKADAEICFEVAYPSEDFYSIFGKHYK